MPIIELTKVFDRELVRRRSSPEDDDEVLQRELFSRGYPQALALFLNESTRQMPVPIFPFTGNGWAESTLLKLGSASLVTTWLDLATEGLIDLERVDPEHFVFWLPSDHVGRERFDVEQEAWMSNSNFEEWSKAAQPAFESIEQSVQERQSALVRTWRDHFIAYDADELVDAYYLGKAMILSSTLPGFDAFPPQATFGEISFDFYRQVLLIEMSVSIKHIGFVNELLKKDHRLRGENLVTIWMEESTVVESLAEFLNAPTLEARRALRAITVSEDNAAYHADDLSIAPFCRIGSNTLLRSVAGAIRAPMYFLLRELKRTYRWDWDRAVNLREPEFRKDLSGLFTSERFVTPASALRVRAGKTVVTDIDAVVHDRTTGTTALFQLKWQDQFGIIGDERRSRRSNLVTESNTWIRRVAEWIHSGDDFEAALRGSGIREIRPDRTYLFVLSRHAVHFTGGTPQDDRAAWGTWPQLIRLVKENKISTDDPLADLAAAFHAELPNVSWTESQPLEIHLGQVSVKFDTRRE
ncbi:MAG: hypothetical protein AB7F65_08830 [Dehalococcoidia bacterium]